MARRSFPPTPQLLLLLLALAATCCAAAASRGPADPLVDAVASAATASESAAKEGGDNDKLGGRTCWYTVQIKTSCASPRRTTDAVSIAFGDAYKNEVYAARLAGSSAAFERCAKDTFRVGGPCGYGVCYLYLRRSGRAGWTPEWVRVSEPTSDTPSTFYYGDPLPDGVWYGFNRCPHRVTGTGAAGVGAAAASSLPAAAADGAAQAL